MMSPESVNAELDAINHAIRRIGWNATISRWGVCLTVVACVATLVHVLAMTAFYDATLPWLTLKVFDGGLFYLLGRLFWIGYARNVALVDLLMRERFNRARQLRRMNPKHGGQDGVQAE